MHVKRNDSNTKNRMKGDFHVRFRERLRVKFPWSTRQRTMGGIGKARGLNLKNWMVSLVRELMRGNKDYEGLLQGAYI